MDLIITDIHKDNSYLNYKNQKTSTHEQHRLLGSEESKIF